MPDLLTTLAPDVLATEVERVVLLEHPGGSDIFETVTENLLTEVAKSNELITTEAVTELITEGVQGPPGPAGVSAEGVFMVSMRLGEIAGNQSAVVEARQNLGLQNIDGGEFT